jgi:O-antigen/teichoic acid export membrane protein
MNYLRSKFIDIIGSISKGPERSVKAKKNILYSFMIKGLSILISLVLVPLTINYINPSRYGVWLTLSSMISWFGFFDIGFGNGLRNKFAEAIAKRQEESAKIYVSTTYAALCIIMGILLILFLCINHYINWVKILNTTQDMANELSILAIIVFVFFCLRFVFHLLNTVLTANQEPAKASFFDFLGNLFSLIIIYILTKTTSGNLIYLGTALSFTPVLVLAASSLWFYSNDYKRFAPSIKYVRVKYAKSLLSIGSIFFFIQIGALLLFQTDNIVITQLFGPKEVTTFNIAYKLFSVLLMVFNIIMTPFWSAFTDAYAKKDWSWIKNTFIEMQKYLLFMSLLAIVLLAISPFIYKLWLNDKVQVPFSLSFVVSSYVIATCWLTLNCFILNGIGKIRLQLYLYIVSTIINIPLAILLGKVIGISGIPLSNLFVLIFMGVILHTQSRKVISNSATGIWNK